MKVPKVHAFRVGICKCTNRYHSHLAGKRFKIRELADRPLEQPIEFRMIECKIDEYDHRTNLRKFRCHVFLDVHRDWPPPGDTRTSIRLIELLPNRSGCNDSVCYDYISGGSDPSHSFSADFIGRRPVAVRTVLKAIERLVSEMSHPQLENWLKRMRPKRGDQ